MAKSDTPLGCAPPQRFSLRRWKDRVRVGLTARKRATIALRSGFFDADYYLRANPDLQEAKVDSLKHFSRRGVLEDRPCYPLFNERWYRQVNPDLGDNEFALSHYLTKGKTEGYDTCPGLSSAQYTQIHPECRVHDTAPAVHLLRRYHSRLKEAELSLSGPLALWHHDLLLSLPNWRERSSTVPAKVSIVIPYFEQGRFLEDAVVSCFLACSAPMEIIVVNDGSTTEASHLTLTKVEKKYGCKVLHQENGGLAAARNRGLAQATGTFIQLLDADDVLLPGKIDRQIVSLEMLRSDVSICDYYSCDAELTNWQRAEPSTVTSFAFRREIFLSRWERGLSIPIHCALFRRTSIAELSFCERVRAKEDWLFWLAVTKSPATLTVLPEHAVLYRQHAHNMSQDLPVMGEQFLKAAEIVAVDAGEDFLRACQQHVRRVYQAPATAFGFAENYQLPPGLGTASPPPSISIGEPDLVSFLLPVFNSEKTLCEALESISKQREQNVEIVVVDDGSTDQTGAILKAFSQKDPRVRIIEQKQNQGIVAALNRGLSCCRGEFVARIDADDISLPSRTTEQKTFLQKHPTVAAVGSAIWELYPDGTRRKLLLPTGPETIATHLRNLGNAFCHSSVMLRTRCLQELGGYRALYQGAEDYDLWLRLAERYPLENLTEPLHLYRLSPDSVSLRSTEAQLLAALAARQAARLRYGGFEDPTPTVPTVLTGELLKKWGLTEQQIVREVLSQLHQIVKSITGSSSRKFYGQRLGEIVQLQNLYRVRLLPNPR